jgi:site-specific DNA recombinase
MPDNITNPLRAAGYSRVSMREQLEGHSLEAQATHIRELAAMQNWQLVELYTDAGLSAKKDSNRPALARLMADAKAGKFDVVVVDKIDRFYRHLRGLLTALDTLNGYGVSFASVQEKLDFTTPWGKLMLTVLGTLAEIYLDNLRQETRKGKHQRAREGLWNGNIPFGYCSGRCAQCADPNGPGYCPNVGQANQGDGKRLIAHPLDHQIVRWAFDYYLRENCSDGRVADYLNSLQYHRPDGSEAKYRQKGVPGRIVPGIFNKDMVRGLLQREFYLGRVSYHSKSQRTKRQVAECYPGQHMALIDEEAFRQAQEQRELLSRNARFKQNKPIQLYPLSGLVRCGYCGLPLRSSSSQGRRIYRDVTQIEHRGHCPQPIILVDTLEDMLLTVLREVVEDGAPLHNVQAQQVREQQVESRWGRARELYLAGAIDRTKYDIEREQYDNEIRYLRELSAGATMTLVHEMRAGFSVWSELPAVKHKKLLRLVLEAAYVRGNALVALQPTRVLLPLFPVTLGCTCGPDEIRTRDLGLDRAACLAATPRVH